MLTAMGQSTPQGKTFISTTVLRELESSGFVSPQSSTATTLRHIFIPPEETIHFLQSNLDTIHRRCDWGFTLIKESNDDRIIIGAWTTKGKQRYKIGYTDDGYVFEWTPLLEQGLRLLQPHHSPYGVLKVRPA
ncbi:hypothetical protein FOXB_02639 [Fusarium oxysporum f. sp. conglutinans Fo5176]|uniref:Uncharacterized protein n=1 Tax=Fusarium oxysporum (strain Fo5176) TaxID=660025 RepID=F9F8B4_FUSOF|nr:hypothetical protein FOXB_02639 [Fusarium oxysporum f. sp. conglutinans Fo5176]